MNVEAQCVGTSTSDTAVAVLPYAERAKQGLRNVKLDDLNWPLGRPERLSTGCVGDMLVNDHLITYPKTKLYFGKEISAKLSLMIVEPDVIHKNICFWRAFSNPAFTVSLQKILRLFCGVIMQFFLFTVRAKFRILKALKLAKQKTVH